MPQIIRFQLMWYKIQQYGRHLLCPQFGYLEKSLLRAMPTAITIPNKNLNLPAKAARNLCTCARQLCGKKPACSKNRTLALWALMRSCENQLEQDSRNAC